MSDELPDGFRCHTRAESRPDADRHTRAAVIVTDPHGTRVSFYADGEVRVHRGQHQLVMVGGWTAGDGSGDNINVLPVPLGGPIPDGGRRIVTMRRQHGRGGATVREHVVTSHEHCAHEATSEARRACRAAASSGS